MKNTIKRAARTFVQTLFGYLSVHMVSTLSGVTDENAMKTAICSLCAAALAAAMAAVMNLPGGNGSEK